MSEASDSSLDLGSYLEAEEDTSEKTLSHFKNEFKRYKRSFNLLSETIDWLYNFSKNKPFDSHAKEAIMLIIPRVMQSIQSIRALLLKGYYYDATILQRSLIESIGLCAYLALNEEEAIRWLEGKDVMTAKIKLFDYVFRLLDTKFLNAKRLYGKLSGFVHTIARPTIVSFVKLESAPKVTVSLTPKFDREKVDEIASYPTLFLLTLSEIFIDEIPQRSREDIRHFIKHYMTEIADVNTSMHTNSNT